ncbi:MAG TPA: exodeoxyribonuclease III [Candidatus Paceibacterota bacterium]|nr:exodeoxyribonuclease III [Candidatus Paceibacterota bacterium]
MSIVKLLSWNVNGIRALEKKGFVEFLAGCDYDMVCLQETKVSDHAVLSERLRLPDGYTAYWHGSTLKKGYSGVAVYSKKEPLSVKTNFGDSILSEEGRMIELEYSEFILLNIYFPNGGSGEARLAYKLEFYKHFLAHVGKLLKKGKKVVFCGDVNTAHKEIDLARPKENERTSGFMPIEREWLDKFEAAGFVDTFRLVHPGETGRYSWWDLKTRSRDRNVGWRIDYFYVSENLKSKVADAFILPEVYGSDHAPVGLTLEL